MKPCVKLAVLLPLILMAISSLDLVISIPLSVSRISSCSFVHKNAKDDTGAQRVGGQALAQPTYLKTRKARRSHENAFGHLRRGEWRDSLRATAFARRTYQVWSRILPELEAVLRVRRDERLKDETNRRQGLVRECMVTSANREADNRTDFPMTGRAALLAPKLFRFTTQLTIRALMNTRA